MSLKVLQSKIYEAVQYARKTTVKESSDMFCISQDTIKRILNLTDVITDSSRVRVIDWATKHNISRHIALAYLYSVDANVNKEKSHYGDILFCDDIPFVDKTLGYLDSTNASAQLGMSSQLFNHYANKNKIPFDIIYNKKYYKLYSLHAWKQTHTT
jgi:hypothetical protein